MPADDATVRSAAIGGSAAPLPSKTTTSGSRPTATRAPAATFDVATPPASPPPQRRHPTVATPTSAAVSRWSDAAWRPLRESSTSDSTVGATVTTSGSAGPPLPIATTTTRRSAASSRARCPVTAVLPTRFPVPTTAIDGQLERLQLGRIEPEVRPDVRDSEGEHAARQREPRDRTEHGLVGEVDDDVGCVLRDRGLDVGNERDTVVLAARAASPARRRRPPRRTRTRSSASASRTTGGVVLAVDDRESSQVRAVTSSSIAPVNFAYSSVSSANDTSFTWPWNGCRRQMSTRVPSISMTL